ncbi:uL15 family ribosomal protein [Sulfurisphaera ohwakuensis]|uniref:Large ribosomal subunit protein uL15 n=1 Tax=Sulfurisphaera ohwakuensis TaxID=69656 RepID=A0A650CDZ8_SULOH|nr:uL15 family ribosomal protein [Sulfurisphaera ohwakuensis]MBB5253013.1 large subunit ribosomal protein L15 [Sulfurisphaera ohwakuensis]QGR16061.1 50S ribosomal protein L15 [Sulfurisphaera ohwakuensis]
MTVRKEKKSRKYRGYRTHGWGTKGQHRDRGAQGSRQIGMHKEKWSWLVKYGEGWYGKHGFVNPTTKIYNAITMRKLQELIEKGEIKIKDENGKKVIDLTEYRYDKLIGSSGLKIPLVIKVNMASKKAIEKVKELGGQIILTTSE